MQISTRTPEKLFEYIDLGIQAFFNNEKAGLLLNLKN